MEHSLIPTWMKKRFFHAETRRGHLVGYPV
jgi:hypothetical protein